MSFIFISYSHKDSDYAHRLAEELEQKGFSVWIDDRIDYGTQWPDVIEEHLDDCGAFIVIMTPRSKKSDWVQNELSRAKRKGKKVFPLLLEGEEPWLSVEAIQYVDVRGGGLPPERFYTELALETEMILPPVRDVRIPTLNEIIESVKRGECILFLGHSGVLGPSTWPRFQWGYEQVPPSRSELSRRLAARYELAARYRLSDADVTNLQTVSHLVESLASRVRLVQAIADEITKPDIVPSPLLHMLAALPFPIVITTNYDCLFDSALSRANTRDGRPKQPIVRIYDPTPTGPTERVSLDPTEEKPILLKLHGDISKPESIVVTDDDHAVFFQRVMGAHHLHPIPKHIRARMGIWPVLFLGCSLRDYNWRLLFKELQNWVSLPFLVHPNPPDKDSQLVASLGDLDRDLWMFVDFLYDKVMGGQYVP